MPDIAPPQKKRHQKLNRPVSSAAIRAGTLSGVVTGAAMWGHERARRAEGGDIGQSSRLEHQIAEAKERREKAENNAEPRKRKKARAIWGRVWMWWVRTSAQHSKRKKNRLCNARYANNKLIVRTTQNI